MDPIIEEEIIIRQPVTEIWNYITCPERIPEWADGISHVENISDSPLKTGSAFRTIYKLADVPTGSSHIVMEMSIPEYLKMKVHYKTLGRTTWSFATENSGTRVSARAEHNLGENKQKTLAKELQRLKQILETGKIPELPSGKMKGVNGIQKDAIMKEHIDASVHVNRPIQEIWDYMMQVDRIPEWAAGATGTVDISDYPIRLGTTFTVVYPLDDEEVKSPHKVLELTPPNVLRLQTHDTIVAFTTWKLASEGNGTKVTVNIKYNFTESGNKAVEKEVSFLKQVLETGKIPEQSLRGKEQW